MALIDQLRAGSPGQMGAPWGTQSTQTKIEDNTTDWTKEHSEAMAPQYNKRQTEFEDTVDWEWIQKSLMDEASKRGLQYDISDLQDIQRHAGYDRSHLGDAGLYNNALQKAYEAALGKYDNRTIYDDTGDAEYYKPGGLGYQNGQAAPTSQAGSNWWQSSQFNYPGGQFSDPWNGQLEKILAGQLQQNQAPAANSPQAMLANYLRQQFEINANGTGYTPEEWAILQTQALEPIEAQRQTAQQRALERTSSRGMLPSSGLLQGEQANNDRYYDRLRTVANRDLAVSGINRLQDQRTRALGLVQSLAGQQQGLDSQAIQLATLLRQLPIDSQNQALAVINGTGMPSNLMGQVQSLLSLSNQQSTQNQNAWLYALGQAVGLLG